MLCLSRSTAVRRGQALSQLARAAAEYRERKREDEAHRLREEEEAAAPLPPTQAAPPAKAAVPIRQDDHVPGRLGIEKDFYSVDDEDASQRYGLNLASGGLELMAERQMLQSMNAKSQGHKSDHRSEAHGKPLKLFETPVHERDAAMNRVLKAQGAKPDFIHYKEDGAARIREGKAAWAVAVASGDESVIELARGKLDKVVLDANRLLREHNLRCPAPLQMPLMTVAQLIDRS